LPGREYREGRNSSFFLSFFFYRPMARRPRPFLSVLLPFYVKLLTVRVMLTSFTLLINIWIIRIKQRIVSKVNKTTTEKMQ
jgi:hypothetical protein